MSNPQFRLRLLDQYWITGSRDPDGDLEDPTSHGKIQLLVHGEDISGCDDVDTDYGINQSAVRLLQTLFADHIPSEWEPSGPFNPIFYHGCAILGTCPNCVIDYRIRHLPEGLVALDRFLVSGGPRGSDPRRFVSRSVQMRLADYAREVFTFAEEALPFVAGPRGLDYEKPMFEELRKEHEFLLFMSQRVVSGAGFSPEERARAMAFDVGTCQLASR